MTRQTAKKIVESLITDLTGHRDLVDAWDSIDQETQEEIMTRWVSIVLETDEYYHD